MAIQVYIPLDGDKDEVVIDYFDPGFTVGAGARVGVYLMTGTQGAFRFTVPHQSAILAALDRYLEDVRTGNYATTSNVIGADLHTEETFVTADSNGLAWEDAGIEVPVLANDRTQLVAASVKRGIEAMREVLPAQAG